MGFWSTAIGAFAGGVVGGPIGAGVGAAIGAWLGGSSGPPELPMELRYEDDEEGRRILLLPGFPLEDQMGFRVDLVPDPGAEPLAATGPLQDDTGAFFTFGEGLLTDDGTHFAEAYVPFGAFTPKQGGQPVLRVITLAGDEIKGVSYFELDWPTVPVMSTAFYLRPMVGLAMAVARADGELARAEVSCIRELLTEAFELQGTDIDLLRQLMKTRDGRTIVDFVHMLLLRMPGVELPFVFQVLAAVAHADGRVHPAEIQVIREIATAWGLMPDDVNTLVVDLGLLPSEDRMSKARELLGVTPEATRAEIRTAFRTKLKAYHPDTVANLAQEFQDLAKTRTQELNDAYQFLLAQAR